MKCFTFHHNDPKSEPLSPGLSIGKSLKGNPCVFTGSSEGLYQCIFLDRAISKGVIRGRVVRGFIELRVVNDTHGFPLKEIYSIMPNRKRLKGCIIRVCTSSALGEGHGFWRPVGGTPEIMVPAYGRRFASSFAKAGTTKWTDDILCLRNGDKIIAHPEGCDENDEFAIECVDGHLYCKPKNQVQTNAKDDPATLPGKSKAKKAAEQPVMERPPSGEGEDEEEESSLSVEELEAAKDMDPALIYEEEGVIETTEREEVSN